MMIGTKTRTVLFSFVVVQWQIKVWKGSSCTAHARFLQMGSKFICSYQHQNHKSSHVLHTPVMLKLHAWPQEDPSTASTCWTTWTHLVIEPVQVTECLQVFASEPEAKAFTQHVVRAASSQGAIHLRLHFLCRQRSRSKLVYRSLP